MNTISTKALSSAGASVRALNPHLFGQLPPKENPLVECSKPKGKPLCEVFAAEAGKRIKQGEKKPSKWEQEWQSVVEGNGDYVCVRAQSLRFRLANGAWYKPDVTGLTADKPQRVQCCWEVKGGVRMKGVAKGTLALKVAAATYPEMRWFIVWKEKGAWMQQRIEP